MDILDTTNVLHFPQLDTVLMVEEFIKEHSGEFRKKNLWKNLPKSMMYQTFSFILEYLTYSGKIAFDSEKKIAWIHNPDLVRKYAKLPHLAAR